MLGTTLWKEVVKVSDHSLFLLLNQLIPLENAEIIIQCKGWIMPEENKLHGYWIGWRIWLFEEEFLSCSTYENLLVYYWLPKLGSKEKSFCYSSLSFWFWWPVHRIHWNDQIQMLQSLHNITWYFNISWNSHSPNLVSFCCERVVVLAFRSKHVMIW